MRKAALITTIVLLIIILAAMGVLLLGGNSPAEDIAETAPLEPAPTPLPAATPEPAPSPTPEPTPEPVAEPEEFVISFVGDCTIASSQHHKGSAYAYETVVGTDYAFPFAGTAEYFETDYLSLANMEGTFTTAQTSSGATFTFKSDPEYAQVFAQGGIDLVLLGNNHSLDYGRQGREDTKAALDAAGVCYADEDDWYIYQNGDGLKVGVYSKLYPTAQNVIDGVTALKDAGAEFIIAGLHWGIEGSYRVTADQTAVGHAAIDAGADIVYGSHPHVLQKTEEYGGGYIFYSLGNWSFGGNTAPRDRDTAIIRATVIRDVDGSVSIGGVEYIPCELSSAQGYNNYQPHPYEPDSEEYQRAMSKLDGSFNGPDLTIDYSAFHDDEGEDGEADNSSVGDGDGSSGETDASGDGEAPSYEPPAENTGAVETE